MEHRRAHNICIELASIRMPLHRHRGALPASVTMSDIPAVAFIASVMRCFTM